MIRKFLILLLLPFTLLAHGGEDHGDAKKASVKPAAYFSNEAVSDVYELLFKYQPLSPGKEAVLKLYASDFNTNTPVDSAAIQITVADNPNIKLTIKQVDKGVYEVSGIFPAKKAYNLTVNINSTLGPDLILVKDIQIGKELAVEHDEVVVVKHWYQSTVFYVLISLLAGMLLMFFIMKKTNRKVASAIIIYVVYCLQRPTIRHRRMVAKMMKPGVNLVGHYQALLLLKKNLNFSLIFSHKKLALAILINQHKY